MKEELLPWLSPDETIEACELLEEIAEMLSKIAQFSPLRRELRQQMADQSMACVEFVQRVRQPSVERSVLLALDQIAEKRKVKNNVLLQEAVEAFVSKINRGEK